MPADTAKNNPDAARVKSFFYDRGLGLGAILLIMVIVCLAQSSISSTLSYGTVLHLLERVISRVVEAETVLHFGTLTLEWLRVGLVGAAVILFLLKRKIPLVRLIIIANAMFTIGLLGQTSGLISELFGSHMIDPNALMRNVVLMIISNILIFSIWYWIIDPPGVERTRHDEPWAFLFPQRGGVLPFYEAWEPHYVDYLFLAFMTSFAFSPTDTLPLNARAKMLMLLQASISVITLVVIASGGINILSGNK